MRAQFFCLRASAVMICVLAIRSESDTKNTRCGTKRSITGELCRNKSVEKQRLFRDERLWHDVRYWNDDDTAVAVMLLRRMTRKQNGYMTARAQCAASRLPATWKSKALNFPIQSGHGAQGRTANERHHHEQGNLSSNDDTCPGKQTGGGFEGETLALRAERES
ncbi:MAG TPA: hypothetical protein PLH97_12095 [Verrucomicrobiota bacterium]|nr:hypothetical protein [Verrucomicrobiota bacterium]